MSRQFRWTLLLVAAVAAAIRVFRLGHFSYGTDEILQGYWLRMSWHDLFAALRADAMHPPLDYVVDWLFEKAHPSEALSKLPAVLWGVGTVAAFGVLIARRAGDAAGLVAASLLALAPFQVRFSQELRPYSLALLALVLSLWALDAYLARPGVVSLAGLFLASLATAYSLYLAAVVLAVVAAAMLAEDAFDPRPERRRAARRLLLGSPLFVFALWLAYLPWWPVVLDLAHRPALATRAPWTWARADRIASFFTFAPVDGDRLGAAGILFVLLVAFGIALAFARRGTRFVAAWGLLGFATIEGLGRLHPHFDFSRRFVPAGPGWVALASLPLAMLLARPVGRLVGAFVLTAVLALDAGGLRTYFRDGRADWRTLADFLRTHASESERVFVENQYAQICLAYYLSGPDWLDRAQHSLPVSWDLPNLEGETVRLNWAWKPGTRAWLVLAGEPKHPPLRDWAKDFPSFSFPRAEGAVLHRLDPQRRPAWIPAR